MKISTSALSKKLEINSKDLFIELQEQKYIHKNESNEWELLKRGEELGGEYKSSSKYGKYIVWPEDFQFKGNIKHKKMSNATEISSYFDISSRKYNQIIAELGWIEKGIKGWKLTSFGKRQGGEEKQHHKSGTFFVLWPENIIHNEHLKNGVENYHPNSYKIIKDENITEDFRKKYPANIRTNDGHMVRSRGEALIDNYLYSNGLVHTYERKVPISEVVYSDFFIPSQRGGKSVYVEYWGIENKDEYDNRKEIKKNLYKKHDLELIEIENIHIENLDDYLPKFLTRLGFKVE